jgi:arylsulfatase A
VADSSRASRAPNVVVILADDMGWGDLGAYGATAIPTPNMDSLAGQGARLTDAHSSSAVCTPSRYSILTGRYAWRGPLKESVLMGHGAAIIEPERSTIASVLRDNGYATGAFGKWHLGLGWAWKDGHTDTAFGPDARISPGTALDVGTEVDYTQPFVGGPIELGFERFFGISGSLDMPPYSFLSQDRTVGIPDRPKREYVTSQRPGLQVDGWRDDAVDERFTSEAVAWLRERGDDERPFFLYLAPAAPHRPCVPPERFRGRSAAGDRGDAVCLVDWMVGEIDAALRELGYYEDTIVILTSDNGAPMIYPEDGDTEHHRPNGPYRGQKGDIWDGGHREPLLVRWPGEIPPGVVRDDLVCLADLYSTILAAAGIAAPVGSGEDSVDVLDILRGGSGERADRADRAVVHHSMSGRFALRMGSWKAEFCTGSGGGFSAPAGDPFDEDHPLGQLYDLAEDPYETRNVWAERPDIVAEAYEMLRSITRDPSNGFP